MKQKGVKWNIVIIPLFGYFYDEMEKKKKKLLHLNLKGRKRGLFDGME